MSNARRTKRLLAVLGVGAFVVWQGVDLVDGWRYFFIPHRVVSYQEYGEDLDGRDLHREYNVLRVSYDCAAIRASTIAELDKTFMTAMRKEQPQETEDTIDNYLVTVEGEGRSLFVRYYGRFDVVEFQNMLTGSPASKSRDALVLRSLLSKVTLTTGPVTITDIEVVPYPSPCDKFVGVEREDE